MAGLYDHYTQTDNIFKGQAPTIGGFDWSRGNYDWKGGGGVMDWTQTPEADWGGSLDLPGLSGTGALGSYGSSNRSTGGDFASKALEALNKAVAYKNQSNKSGVNASSASATVEQVRPDLTIITPAPKQKTTGGSGGGGLLGTIGQGVGLAGTALGVFGPLGPAIGALAGGIASRATGV